LHRFVFIRRKLMPSNPPFQGSFCPEEDDFKTGKFETRRHKVMAQRVRKASIELHVGPPTAELEDNACGGLRWHI